MISFDQLPESEKIQRYVRLAKKGLAAYGLEEAEIEGRLGTRNVVFEVRHVREDRSQVHYALRICSREASSDQLLRELLWLTSLCQGMAAIVPEPVLSRSGKLIHSVSVPGVSGFHSVVLLRWVRGKPLDIGQLPLETIREIGRLLGRLHGHGETFRWPEELEHPAGESPDVTAIPVRMRRLYARFPELESLVAESIDLVRRSRVVLSSEQGTAGVIHGAAGPKNFLLDRGEVRAIGFDHCRRGFHLEDLEEMDNALRRREDAKEARAEFIDGYRSIRSLPADSELHLDAYAALRVLHRLADLNRSSPSVTPSDRIAELGEHLKKLVE